MYYGECGTVEYKVEAGIKLVVCALFAALLFWFCIEHTLVNGMFMVSVCGVLALMVHFDWTMVVVSAFFLFVYLGARYLVMMLQ